MTSDDEKLLVELIIESHEHLSSIEPDLLLLEKGKDISKETINRVFRTMHSIKGIFAFFGMENITNLSHLMENVMMKVRDEEMDITPEILDALFAGVDTLRIMLADVKNSENIDFQMVKEDLSAILKPSRMGETPKESVKQKRRNRDVAEKEDTRTEGKLYAANKIHAFNQKKSAPKKENDESPRILERSLETAESIRVRVGLLNKLVNLAGELVLGRNQLLQRLKNTEEAGLKAILQNIDMVTSELQENIMNTRMQPIGSIFNKFPRIIRDLARNLKKDIELSLSGENVELDKSIIEALADPLTHLIRNSVDHGIEPPDVREKSGKARVGTISLEAFHEGGQVNIEIKDDGKEAWEKLNSSGYDLLLTDLEMPLMDGFELT
ncbi:MAG: Hpt domain-containing protein [bacterium]